MGEITWYKRYPEDALSGMMGLSLEERGAYNTVLDLIYTRDGKLPDDDRFIAGWLGCDVRVWRRIRDRLIGLGKLYSTGGFLCNSRADEEVLTALSRVGSARDAGKASARSRASKSKRKTNENNDRLATPAATGAPTAVSTNQNQSSVPNGTGGNPPSLADRLWSDGLAILTNAAVPERQARSLVGKWRKSAGDGGLLAILTDCQAQAIADPVPWIEAAVKARGNGTGPPRRGGRDEPVDYLDYRLEQRRQREEWERERATR